MKTETQVTPKGQHTKGEWKLLRTLQVGIDGKVIANIDPLNGKMDDENIANAKLIASAPKLLKALSGLIQDIEHYSSVGMLPSSTAIEIAKQALKKATE